MLLPVLHLFVACDSSPYQSPSHPVRPGILVKRQWATVLSPRPLDFALKHLGLSFVTRCAWLTDCSYVHDVCMCNVAPELLTVIVIIQG